MTIRTATQPLATGLYTPPVYRAQSPEWIVDTWPFATIVSPSLHATETPLFFEDETRTTLLGHLSRRNPHAALLEGDAPVLALFRGPDDYISPTWYREKAEVPTWNYVSAQAHGRVEAIDDKDGILAILAMTAQRMESAEIPWTLESAQEGRVDFLLPMIRGFRIRIGSLEGITKLSQSHPPSDRHRVADALALAPLRPSIASLIQTKVDR